MKSFVPNSKALLNLQGFYSIQKFSGGVYLIKDNRFIDVFLSVGSMKRSNFDLMIKSFTQSFAAQIFA
jgi:hypothetical protein